VQSVFRSAFPTRTVVGSVIYVYFISRVENLAGDAVRVSAAAPLRGARKSKPRCFTWPATGKSYLYWLRGPQVYRADTDKEYFDVETPGSDDECDEVGDEANEGSDEVDEENDVVVDEKSKEDENNDTGSKEEETQSPSARSRKKEHSPIMTRSRKRAKGN
jgi:hypothetical protein